MPTLRRIPSLVLVLKTVSLLLVFLQHTQRRRRNHISVAAFRCNHHLQRPGQRRLGSPFAESDGNGSPSQWNPGNDSSSRFVSTGVARAPSLFQRKTIPRKVAMSMLPTLPPTYEYDDSVVFFQRATATRIEGRKELERSIQRWEKDFGAEVDVDGKVDRNTESNEPDNNLQGRPRLVTTSATTTSPTTLLLRWSLTYIDPSVRWLEALAGAVPGWTADFSTYTDRVSEERRFSYSAVGKLFARAFATGKLRIPLACIEGVTTCEFVVQDGNEREPGKTNDAGSSGATRKIRSIVEDLAYAQDLNRGAMANRVCARDLQFFLETARKPPEFYRDGISIETTTNNNNNYRDDLYWEDLVASALPWRSVPGMMDPLYIETQAEEDLAANLPVIFGAVAFGALAVFANWIAPELIGQSLFGDPTYIVRPSELNEVIAY